MKPVIRQETVLKALLLLVVAANVSGGKSASPFHQYDAASGSESAPSAGGGRLSGPSAPGVNRPEARSATPVAPAAPQTRNEHTVTIRSEERKLKSETKKICDVEFYIEFSEVAGQNKTHELVTERYPEQKALLAIDEVGSYATLVENADGKSQTDRVLEARIREALGPAKCGTANQVNANQPVKPGEQGPTADEEKARIALGVKECRLDSKGKPLDRAASLDCNESRLSTLAAVNTDDRAAKREAQSKVDGVVKQIQKDLRLEMKDAFLNGNADDARDLLDAATEAINDAGSTLDLSQAQIDRLVKPMSNTYVAMKMGEETLQASDQLRTKYDQISQNAMTARLNMDQAQQSGDAYAGRVALQQYQYALNDNLRLNSEFNTMVAPRFSTLQGYQRMNWLDASDFRDFTKGYTSLQNDIATLARGGNSASQLPTSTMSAPSDLSSIRSGYADQFRTNYGVQIPTMPTSLFTSMTSQPNLGTIGGLGRRSN